MIIRLSTKKMENPTSTKRSEVFTNGKRHFYFGSIAAIFDELSEEQIGIKKESLWNVDLSRVEYQNKYCTIRMGVLIRKKTFRGNTKIGG